MMDQKYQNHEDSQLKELKDKLFKKDDDYYSYNWQLVCPIEIAQIFNCRDNLRYLSLDIKFKLQSNQFEQLINILVNQKYLTQISFQFDQLDFNFVSLQDLKNIKSLSLKTTTYQICYQGSLIKLGKCLESLHNLQHLQLQFYGEPFNENYCILFGNSLSKLQYLLSFSMTLQTFSVVNDTQLEHIISALSKLQNLISLNIKLCYYRCNGSNTQNYQSLINQSTSLTSSYIEFQYGPILKNGFSIYMRQSVICQFIAFIQNISEFLTINPQEVFYDLYSSLLEI